MSEEYFSKEKVENGLKTKKFTELLANSLRQNSDFANEDRLGMYTDAEINLHTPLVKYYNDLLGIQSSEWSMDEVTFFYVGTCVTHLTVSLFLCSSVSNA